MTIKMNLGEKLEIQIVSGIIMNQTVDYYE